MNQTDALIEQAIEAPAAGLVSYLCLNGPHSGSSVDAPEDATTGTACALGWKNLKNQPRFAVYVLVDHNGARGLMYMQSYTKADYATAKVKRLTETCAGMMA